METIDQKNMNQITIATVYITKTPIKGVTKMAKWIKRKDVRSADQIQREFEPRDIYTYCDTGEDGTLFVGVFGAGNGRWFWATFNTKKRKDWHFIFKLKIWWMVCLLLLVSLYFSAIVCCCLYDVWDIF